MTAKNTQPTKTSKYESEKYKKVLQRLSIILANVTRLGKKLDKKKRTSKKIIMLDVSLGTPVNRSSKCCPNEAKIVRKKNKELT